MKIIWKSKSCHTTHDFGSRFLFGYAGQPLHLLSVPLLYGKNFHNPFPQFKFFNSGNRHADFSWSLGAGAPIREICSNGTVITSFDWIKEMLWFSESFQNVFLVSSVKNGIFFKLSMFIPRHCHDQYFYFVTFIFHRKG